ncbi:ATP-dependent DNA ligase [Cytobacillus kochii]|uniref:ATP-dependent DNA ligase n=1 Tax=Cytobacillus kochii TaxID=859143 RepID=UPI001CD3342A|nr:RNA ligase family protein [Cytobacillus kochii]MCA1026998.1 ATP-dependent DNA ligase [Cytobacillus kochii]
MYVSPMLLHKTDAPFDDSNWITQLKLDGIRCVLSKFDYNTKLYSRHKNEITNRFKDLVKNSIPHGTVLDGEIIVSDQNSKPNFELVMEKFQSTKSDLKITYCIFDIIYYKHKKVTHLPLLERLSLINSVLENESDQFALVPFVDGTVTTQYFNLIKDNDLEGIVIKRKDSKYEINKRSNSWLKLINYKYTNVELYALRQQEFGALLRFPSGHYAGCIEFMSPDIKQQLYSKIRDMEKYDNNNPTQFSKPLHLEVKFRNYTSKGLLRIPSFNRWL